MPRFSSTKTFEQIKRARKLPERSHLTIEFPQSDNRVFRAYLPFLQNPIISEKGTANLVEYDLVGRNGSLYGYAGAKSRVFNVRFTINLLHVLYSDATEGLDRKFLRQFNLFYADKERAKKAFQLRPGGEYDQTLAKEELAKESVRSAKSRQDFNQRMYDMSVQLYQQRIAARPFGIGVDDSTLEMLVEAQETFGAELEGSDENIAELESEYSEAQQNTKRLTDDIGQEFIDSNSSQLPDIPVAVGFPHAEVHRTFYRQALGIMTGGYEAAETPITDEISNYLIEKINDLPLDGFGNARSNTIPTPQEQMNRINTLINAIYVWINLVRATTMNRSDNTTFGSPIVRLTHGPMYNNVPCVVSDYNIDMNQSAGYEVETLTPKEITISMTLKEFRTPGTFIENEIEEGDHLTGWEAIINNNNIDPYNGDITRSELEQFPTQTINFADVAGPALR